MKDKNNQPLVSVLLSIYKVEEYLEECLDSILKQSYKNLEIVCVDNGSPDKCGEILKRYAKLDKRIKIVTLKENQMLCGGRNAGLDNATGEFICFVDPDDWIEEDHIKVMVDAILTKKDVNGNFYNLILNSSAVNYFNDINGTNIISDYQKNEKCISINDYNDDVELDTEFPMWGRLYRRSFLDEVNVRFIDGVNIDNIPFTGKLLAKMKYFYRLPKMQNIRYWRRMISLEGSLTPLVLYKSFDIINALDNFYEYLISNNLSREIKVPFTIFFNIIICRHADQPRYYIKFKELMHKMEDVIKSTPDVYNQDDIDLCNMLLYTDNYFQFNELFFCKFSHQKTGDETIKYKLFNIITFFQKKTRYGMKTTYYIMGIPVIKVKRSNKLGARKFFLFGLPLLKISIK